MNRCDICGKDTDWKVHLCETCDGHQMAAEILDDFRAALPERLDDREERALADHEDLYMGGDHG